LRIWCQAPGGIAIASPAAIPLELHLALTLEDEVDLLRLAVVVPLRRVPRLERRLGEALVDRAARRQTAQLANRASVRGDERLGRRERPDIH
jgi:hypothetical protein